MVRTGSTRQLKFFAVIAAVFFGIVPVVLIALLVARGNTPGAVGLLLIGGVPLLAAGLLHIVRGFRAADPEAGAALLQRGMGFIAGADVLLLGGNAVIRMIVN